MARVCSRFHAVMRAGGWVLFLEQAVNERRQRGTLRKNQHPAQQQKEHHDRRNPPFLLLEQKLQKLSDDRQSVHCLSRLAMVSNTASQMCCERRHNEQGRPPSKAPSRLPSTPASDRSAEVGSVHEAGVSGAIRIGAHILPKISQSARGESSSSPLCDPISN